MQILTLVCTHLGMSKFEVDALFSSSDFGFISFFFMIELAKKWLLYYTCICLFILLNTEIISVTLFNVSFKLFKLASKTTAIIILRGGRFELKTCI